FDTGPGNALVDDWMFNKTDSSYDNNGDTARKGNIDVDILSKLMAHPYFDKKAPKSLDRNTFSSSLVKDLSLENGAATLTAFTVKSIVQAIDNLPQAPKQWLVSGGGRHNGFIMDLLRKQLDVPVDLIDEHGFNGDFTEAEAFAYLAVRSKLGLPISFPETTGAPTPMTGGVFHPAGKIRKEETS
ncbi:MAG: anhydro-N-acetylmuramic acid kinase, partial [Gammaproteobacteria bacterium]|nr:anhydro-N-acetylmuramic acid kinase [Gammaproteobacteria bacterium]